MIKDIPNNVLKTIAIGRVAASILSGSTFFDNTVLYRCTLDSLVGNSFNIRVLNAPRAIRASYFQERASNEHPTGSHHALGATVEASMLEDRQTNRRVRGVERSKGGAPQTRQMEQRRCWAGVERRGFESSERAIGQSGRLGYPGRINNWGQCAHLLRNKRSSHWQAPGRGTRLQQAVHATHVDTGLWTMGHLHQFILSRDGAVRNTNPNSRQSCLTQRRRWAKISIVGVPARDRTHRALPQCGISNGSVWGRNTGENVVDYHQGYWRTGFIYLPDYNRGQCAILSSMSTKRCGRGSPERANMGPWR